MLYVQQKDLASANDEFCMKDRRCKESCLQLLAFSSSAHHFKNVRMEKGKEKGRCMRKAQRSFCIPCREEAEKEVRLGRNRMEKKG